jgi:hypothetical protein
MDTQWSTIWQYSHAVGRKRRRGAFDDPLDSPEWEGLVWVPVLAVSFARRITDMKLAFPIRGRAHGPVKAAPDHGICVS